jgi:putative transposase
MIVHRGFRFKLKPTPEQESLFRQFAGVCRFVYNLALEQREKYRDTYEYIGQRVCLAQQCRELTLLRAEVDWIGAVHSTPQTQALRDLDRAFVDFFAGRKAYPKPRIKGLDDSFRFKGTEVSVRPINRKWSFVRVPKIGWVKFRHTRPVEGSVKNATIIHDALGWHVAFGCEVDREVIKGAEAIVGIDRGVAKTLTLSNGEALCIPESLNVIDRRYRRAQRVVARRKKGSQRRLKAVRRCAAIAARRARIRSDWHHKTSRVIADQFSVVVMEELRIVNMTASAKGTVEVPGTNVRQKAGLNRSILNQGWGSFAAILGYKLEERGGNLVMVDPAYTSQTCSACGTVDKTSRKSQAVFHCQNCGFRANADHNAALNILRRNTASMGVEEGHWLSGEALTRDGVAVENQTAIAV